MIPSNRPVIGRDLEDLRIANGYSVADACWIFGISPTKWTQIVRKNCNEPVKPPMALLVRAMDQFATKIIPEMPTPSSLLSLLNESSKIDKKRFSIISGRTCGSYRWLTLGGRQPALLQRLSFCLMQHILSTSEPMRSKVIESWLKTVESEALARQIDDIYINGRWVPNAEREGRKKQKRKVNAKNLNTG